MARYTIGLDFGTLSGRAVLVDAATGDEIAESSFDYPHGVMDKTLPDGTPLGDDWALQHPQDYLLVLENTIPDLIGRSGVSSADIIGVGVDFTACTILPVKADGAPLCFIREYQSNPHAYVKLWKHHAAQEEANRINEAASQRSESWLARYGGKVNSEWAIPKVWQILNEAPEVYEEADMIMEAADWIIWQLTGVQTKNACCAGYKGNWSKREGYPSGDFFKALDPRLENLIEDKMNCPVSPLGGKAGEISEKAAEMTGLNPGTAVAVGIIDAHVFVPATKIDSPGKMVAIIGTSTCHMLIAGEERMVPGISGVVEDGIYPGYFAYEAGQGCVGDHFSWFIDRCVPRSYFEAADAEGKRIHSYLTEKAAALSPGESGLVALDWWNGVRSVLVDADLTGMIVGLTLQTKPEEIYRALIEATAFGTRKIIETFRSNGVPVDEFYAAGGIAQKNPLMMQIYSDVIDMPVKISGSAQGGALGSAIFGAVAAGKKSGGYDDVFEAAAKMGKLKDEAYFPVKENVRIYDKLYAEYNILHDYFGRGTNDVMKRLKEIRKNSILIK